MKLAWLPSRTALAAASLAVALGAAVTGCARSEPATVAAPIPAAATSHATAGARPRLVFFMNPGGRPCQLQDQVLQSLAGELQPRAEVVYYRTTEPGDLQRFQDYGIRALPQLIVTDGAGRELRRATPGIQSPEQVRQLLAL